MTQLNEERHLDSYVDGYDSEDSEDEFDDTQYGTMVRSSPVTRHISNAYFVTYKMRGR